MMDAQTGRLETWAVLDLMGHARLAGFVRDVPLGTHTMLRVEVPEVRYKQRRWKMSEDGGEIVEEMTIPAFVDLVGVPAVYSITPCTEEVAIRAAVEIKATPPEMRFPVVEERPEEVGIPF